MAIEDNEDREGQKGTVYTIPMPFMFATEYILETQLLTIGADEEDWLDEHAEGWREKVRVQTYRASRVVSEEQILGAGRHEEMSNLLSWLMKGLAHALATDIIKGVEPIVRKHSVEQRWRG